LEKNLANGGEVLTTETVLAKWITRTGFDDLNSDVVKSMKLLVRTIFGVAVSGATSNGIEATVEQVKDWGGKPEATIWLHGGKVPAHAAVLANSAMARANDICDAAIPGQHIGTSVVPAAIAMAEHVGGLSGKEFITAIALGCEISTRLGVVCRLDGFDPTGTCSIFAPCIAAGKILGLTEKQMLHAMALVFNKAGSSFQSNVDASLAVRLIQGFVSQDGIICAQLAKRDITGPVNWLKGVWGYYHLFCKDRRDDATMVGKLGEHWQLKSIGYKTRPQCGATIASTDAIFELLQRHAIEPEDVERIDIHMASEGPCTLVGSEFELSDYPQVSGQFNVRYCVANAIARKSSELRHFTNEAVSDPYVATLARRVYTHVKPELAGGKPHLVGKVALEVHLTDGRTLTCGVDGPSGFPPYEKLEAQHRADFDTHVAFGGIKLPADNIQKILSMVEDLERVEDVREFAVLLTAH
jgi:2-methylcitrate dehydratase PrpD